MSKKFSASIIYFTTIFLLQGCDMGTRLYLQAQLTKPASDRCIEDALSTKAGMTFKKNNLISRDTISSYSFSGPQVSGGVHQVRNSDGQVSFDLGAIWIGGPYPLEEEKQKELYFRELLAEIESKCHNSELNNATCLYDSFYSKEKRCPTERNTTTRTIGSRN